jgi:hypothetical protein
VSSSKDGKRSSLIKALLKPHEHLPDVVGPAQLGHGVGEGLVFEFQELGQFFEVQFADAAFDVVVQDEVEELLLGVIAPKNVQLRYFKSYLIFSR